MLNGSKPTLGDAFPDGVLDTGLGSLSLTCWAVFVRDSIEVDRRLGPGVGDCALCPSVPGAVRLSATQTPAARLRWRERKAAIGAGSDDHLRPAVTESLRLETNIPKSSDGPDGSWLGFDTPSTSLLDVNSPSPEMAGEDS